MSGSVLVAVAAAVGNLLQGWDNATIAGRFISSFHGVLPFTSKALLKYLKICLHCCFRGRLVH